MAGDKEEGEALRERDDQHASPLAAAGARAAAPRRWRRSSRGKSDPRAPRSVGRPRRAFGGQERASHARCADTSERQATRSRLARRPFEDLIGFAQTAQASSCRGTLKRGDLAASFLSTAELPRDSSTVDTDGQRRAWIRPARRGCAPGRSRPPLAAPYLPPPTDLGRMVSRFTGGE